VLAALSGPIAADYVPAGKPPWVLLAVLLALLAVVLPHQFLGPTYALFGLGFVLYRVGRRCDERSTDANRSTEPDRLAA
jgi:hypothetical protein